MLETSGSESLYEEISGAWNGLVRLWTWIVGADARLRFGPGWAVLVAGELCFATTETVLDGLVFELGRTGLLFCRVVW